ncbi:MAG TPA: hypothetical protein VMH23_02445 [Bacteroidota bacterium]|nr:hypothetical protein [Bacteroidota bacterium]
MTRLKEFIRNYRIALLAWAVIVLVIYGGLYYSVDKSVVALAVIAVGVLGHAFGALLAWIAFVPLFGPMIAHVLSLPFIWLINGVGYVASIIAIKRGYSKDVLSYRIITMTLLFGITCGYVLGKLI